MQTILLHIAPLVNEQVYMSFGDEILILANISSNLFILCKY